ncbi:hypothetical protein BH09BAC4_BH09BAC4_10150 [soil metagenome]
MDLHIIPECYVDTKLVKVAVPPQTRYNHQKGCSTVLKTMQEKFTDGFAVGIIDKDKQIQIYVEQFDVIYDVMDVLQLLKHPDKHHYLIFICPAVEKWILLNADEVNLSLTEFGLPHDFNQLKVITKTSKSENDDPYSANIQQLFKEIKRRESRYWMILSLWIEYLKANPYNADMAFLVQETERMLVV